MKHLTVLLIVAVLVLGMSACGRSEQKEDTANVQNTEGEAENVTVSASPEENEVSMMEIPKSFVLIEGGTFQMGSPETESWRSDDETQHTVTVSNFYMSQYELTQEEYEKVMGNNPSNFSGSDLPVDNISWLDAVSYCNARSESKGLTPVYTIDGQNVSWDRSANGYRLPTEAEWEYACRTGTVTPFHTETSISAEEANYYGHYPYMIEDNYFSQGNLDTQPGEYRQTTVAVDSFSPNAFGLYNTHGNVGEWVWDYYGEYPKTEETDPVGQDSGILRVYRGGGWNDFAKNMRSAYRATLAQDKGSFNIGMCLVLNAAVGSGSVTGTALQQDNGASDNENVLIAYFSWGGNTAGIAGEIQRQTGADLFEITLVNPYSNDYNTVLDEAQRDQNEQARHDFEGKTIIPFCSHGGGRFGQSLTAITKLVPDAVMGEALSVHYSGGATLNEEISQWLEINGIEHE